MSFTIKKGKEQEYTNVYTAYMEDEYREEIVAFAESWGERMETALEAAEGGIVFTKPIYDVHKQIDMYEELTGAMVASAVALLASFWKYGDAFNNFHNKNSGVRVVQSGVRSRV